MLPIGSFELVFNFHILILIQYIICCLWFIVLWLIVLLRDLPNWLYLRACFIPISKSHLKPAFCFVLEQHEYVPAVCLSKKPLHSSHISVPESNSRMLAAAPHSIAFHCTIHLEPCITRSVDAREGTHSPTRTSLHLLLLLLLHLHLHLLLLLSRTRFSLEMSSLTLLVSAAMIFIRSLLHWLFCMQSCVPLRSRARRSDVSKSESSASFSCHFSLCVRLCAPRHRRRHYHTKSFNYSPLRVLQYFLVAILQLCLAQSTWCHYRINSALRAWTTLQLPVFSRRSVLCIDLTSCMNLPLDEKCVKRSAADCSSSSVLVAISCAWRFA